MSSKRNQEAAVDRTIKSIMMVMVALGGVSKLHPAHPRVTLTHINPIIPLSFRSLARPALFGETAW